jgi:hypothetical protein
MKWVDHAELVGDEKYLKKFWPENLKGTGNLEDTGHSHRSEYNIKVDLKDVGWLSVDWVHFAHCTVQ